MLVGRSQYLKLPPAEISRSEDVAGIRRPSSALSGSLASPTSLCAQCSATSGSPDGSSARVYHNTDHWDVSQPTINVVPWSPHESLASPSGYNGSQPARESAGPGYLDVSTPSVRSSFSYAPQGRPSYSQTMELASPAAPRSYSYQQAQQPQRMPAQQPMSWQLSAPIPMTHQLYNVPPNSPAASPYARSQSPSPYYTDALMSPSPMAMAGHGPVTTYGPVRAMGGDVGSDHAVAAPVGGDAVGSAPPQLVEVLTAFLAQQQQLQQQQQASLQASAPAAAPLSVPVGSADAGGAADAAAVCSGTDAAPVPARAAPRAAAAGVSAASAFSGAITVSSASIDTQCPSRLSDGHSQSVLLQRPRHAALLVPTHLPPSAFGQCHQEQLCSQRAG